MSESTMRTLVGVDGQELYGLAIELLGRLKFAGNEVTLAHAEPSVGLQFASAALVYQSETAIQIESTMRTLGKRWLETAADMVRRAGLGDEPKREYLVGFAAPALMDCADRLRSDLVAIGARHHGSLECFILGSVGRALAVGAHQSFLVARGNPKGTGKVKVVFATDHSEYANRCFARLLDMNPQGFGHVTVVTATESDAQMALYRATGYDERTPESITEAEAQMRSLGERMVARLAARNIPADYRLVEGLPEEAIRRTMESTDADLLILGSRGHGFFERVLIGSLALHAVVAESFSVLVLRIPEA